MKKKISNFIILFFVSFILFSSCGSDSQMDELVGSWVMEWYEIVDCPPSIENVPLTEVDENGCIQEGTLLGCNPTYNFYEDLSFEYTVTNQTVNIDTLYSGTYSFVENTGELTICFGNECETELFDNGLFTSIPFGVAECTIRRKFRKVE